MRPDKEPPSPPSALLLERHRDIVRNSLNRPEKLNALSVQLQSELRDALSAVAADSSVRVLIVSGKKRAFCAGSALHEIPESLTHFQTRPRNRTVFRLLDELPLAVIGAINGLAVTGGFELAQSCNLLIASTNARFAETHGRIGVMPGTGVSQRLSRILRLRRVMAVSLTGEYFINRHRPPLWLGLPSGRTGCSNAPGLAIGRAVRGGRARGDS